MFFIWNTIGAGLNEYIKQADNFSFISLLLNKEIYIPIILFVIVILISAIIKKEYLMIKKINKVCNEGSN